MIAITTRSSINVKLCFRWNNEWWPASALWSVEDRELKDENLFMVCSFLYFYYLGKLHGTQNSDQFFTKGEDGQTGVCFLLVGKTLLSFRIIGKSPCIFPVHHVKRPQWNGCRHRRCRELVRKTGIRLCRPESGTASSPNREDSCKTIFLLKPQRESGQRIVHGSLFRR